MNSRARSAENYATAGPFAEIADRFPLGRRNGIIVPTAESISDTATTPFGLTLRTIPAQNGELTMGSDRVTLIETDGRGPDVDTEADYITD